jgi:hypothetical protein
MNLPAQQNDIRSATPDEHPDIGPRDIVLPLASPPLRRTRNSLYKASYFGRQIVARDILP